MKRLRAILQSIHQWPEEARSILAGFLFLVSAAALYGIWNADISYRLGELSSPAAPEETEIAYQSSAEKSEEAPSPIAGITASFRSLGQILPNVEKGDVTSGLSAIERAAENALSKLANFIFP